VRVLVACEFSGVVRRAFQMRGHIAWSCDLLPSEDSSRRHFQCDVRDVLGNGWDLMIAHPPCTHLAVSGARHFAAKQASGVQEEALQFVRDLLGAPIPMIALENPISIIRNQGNVPVAQEPAAAGPDQYCRWPRGARSPDAARARSLERAQPYLRRHCRSDG
jgi:hypothetical protein